MNIRIKAKSGTVHVALANANDKRGRAWCRQWTEGTRVADDATVTCARCAKLAHL